MKLLVIYHGGATRQIRALATTLATYTRDPIELIVPEQVSTDPTYEASGWIRSEAEEGNGYRIQAVPLHDPTAYWRGFLPIPLLYAIRNARADAIHVLDEPLSAYLMQTIKGATLVSPRARIFFYGFENVPPVLSPRARLRWRAAWRRIAGGAASSLGAIEAARSAGVPAKIPIERVFWAVDAAFFERAERRASRETLGLPAGPLIGFVGRLVPEKGVGVLLEALPSLRDDASLLLIGTGPLAAHVRETAAASGRIQVRDPLAPEALAEHLSTMTALVLPSLTTATWKEQYGRVIAEAMAASIPVVCSNSGAIPEVVGGAGIVVPEGRPDKLAEALNGLLDDCGLRRSLAAAGAARARKNFSTDAMAEGLTNLYRLALA